MRRIFFCIDGHTAGNPVRLVAAGAPRLIATTMSDRRLEFLREHDSIRRGLMFEPRGHDMMSGGFLYPPADPAHDGAILFMETSGCLPMCGHGAIGMITFALEQGYWQPTHTGPLQIEVPAGVIEARYERKANKVTSVTLTNVASYLAARDVTIEVEGLGSLKVDIAYGGNFYAIIEPQGRYQGVDALGADAILRLSPKIRAALQAKIEPVHPLNPSIRGVTHVLWADPWTGDGLGRSAVFYGDRAIDRSPCGTGTSARLAQLFARKRMAEGESLRHNSILNTTFIATIASATMLGPERAIVPTIQGSAWQTGINQIWLDDDEPFPEGFQIL